MEKLSSDLLGLPVLASKHGVEVDRLIIYIHYLMAALFVGWGLYFLFVVFRFRAKANPKADYVGVRGHFSSYIELAVVAVEAVLLFVFAIPLWAGAVDRFPTAAEHPIVIKVIAQQFNWNVIYPGADGVIGRQDPKLVSAENPLGFDKSDPKGKDDIVLNNEIRVPVNRPVIITLSSKDVIHSFKLIAMRVTQDAIPGLAIPIHFTPTKTGVYQINCAQLCGIGHSNMAGGRFYVVTQEEYDKWLAEKSKGGGATSFE